MIQQSSIKGDSKKGSYVFTDRFVGPLALCASRCVLLLIVFLTLLDIQYTQEIGRKPARKQKELDLPGFITPSKGNVKKINSRE